MEPNQSTNLDLTDNGVSGAIPLPFTFFFYGRAYREIYVGANGLLGFDPLNMDLAGNADIPSPNPPNGLICPYWDDLNPASGGAIVVGVAGTAPRREWVASWLAVPKNSSLTTRLTFQAVLAEASQEIRFQYQEVMPEKSGGAGRRATIGLELESGVVGNRYAYNGQPSAVSNQMALSFRSLSPPPLAVFPASPNRFRRASRRSV